MVWFVLSAGHSSGLSLLVVLLLSGAGSLALLGVAVAALARKRSRSYLLIALTLAALAARTGVAGLTVMGRLPDGTHHLLEHGLDAASYSAWVEAAFRASIQ